MDQFPGESDDSLSRFLLRALCSRCFLLSGSTRFPALPSLVGALPAFPFGGLSQLLVKLVQGPEGPVALAGT